MCGSLGYVGHWCIQCWVAAVGVLWGCWWDCAGAVMMLVGAGLCCKHVHMVFVLLQVWMCVAWRVHVLLVSVCVHVCLLLSADARACMVVVFAVWYVGGWSVVLFPMLWWIWARVCMAGTWLMHVCMAGVCVLAHACVCKVGGC